MRSQNKYRKDIDGLRALSVILVILYHLDFTWIPSGFIGVDIFFVISGFLITSHIIKDIGLNRFSIKNFYLKRMRRILPALLVMLIITTIAAYFLLLPIVLVEYFKTLIATILSVSNLFYWKIVDVGYFSTDSSVIPLLHTWSLGVEEQFYLIWPILLILLFKFFKPKQVFWISVLFLMFSLGIYLGFSERKTFIYYTPIARSFELLFGVLMALWYKKTKVVNNKFLLNVLSIIGIIGILFISFFTSVKAHPWLAVIPCVGASLLIYTGIQSELKKQPIANRFLSIKPMVLIGVISYSLYLWHWPIIAYINYIGIPITYTLAVLVIVVSIILAILSYFLVERPFRFKFKFKFYKTLILFFIAPLLTTVLLTWITNLIYLPIFKSNKLEDKIYSGSVFTKYGILSPEAGCLKHKIFLTPPDPSICAIGSDKSHLPTEVILIGDSHAFSDVGMVHVFLKNSELSGHVAAKIGTRFYIENEKKWNYEVSKQIKENKYKYVILAGFWGGDNNQNKNKVKYGLLEAVKLILKQNSIPVIILDTPPLFDVRADCDLVKFSTHHCSNKAAKVIRFDKQTRNLIFELKELYPEIILIDPTRVICNKEECLASLHGIPLYADSNRSNLNSHLSYEGSKAIGVEYIKMFGNPFIRKP